MGEFVAGAIVLDVVHTVKATQVERKAYED
jgi:hypothetical protein